MSRINKIEINGQIYDIAGEDGLTPYIGENGNWWIGDTDTGSKAQGDKGDNAYLSIKDDGNGNVTLETHNKEEILTDDGEGNVFFGG